MISFALKAARQMFSQPFRGVLIKSLALTIGLFIMVWFGLQAVLRMFTIAPYPWVDTAIAILAGLGLLVGMVFVMAPVTALFAGLFLDDISETVEQVHYPADPPGVAQPIMRSLIMGVKFFLVMILVYLVILILLLVPGLNLIAYFLGAGYLLSREYFEMVGMRHLPLAEVRALRREHRATVWGAGALIALLAAVPFANLLTPLFATAFMVHLFKSLSRRQPRRAL